MTTASTGGGGGFWGIGSSCGFLDSIFVAVTSNELRLLSTTSKLLVSLSESAHFLTSIEDEGAVVVEE